MHLQKRWNGLWPEAVRTVPDVVVTTFARLYGRYGERHRAYHTLSHIEDCLTQFDHARHLAKDPLAVEAALWWHDLIYDVGSGTENENLSAQVAKTDMEALGCGSDFRAKVASFILATRHDTVSVDSDEQLVCDIDLHTLGVYPALYERYKEAIRREYEWVPWQTYAEKRISILEKFLSREHIYYHDFFRERFEAPARKNIRRDIEKLRKSLR